MPRIAVVFALFLIASSAAAQAIVKLTVDCSKVTGEIRSLHGGNGGALGDGGLTDLSAYFREAQIPLMRLHDCHWPNPDVVDMHVVFPDPRADPANPKSYDFRRTDEYISAIRATGAKIVYRLGESIEHTQTKYYVHPPVDPQRWAQACVEIVRHYKESVEYWEIWNEPENRPAMWTGSDEQYLQLYALTAAALRKEFPQLKIGGPSLGYSGRIKDGGFEASEFLLKFLDHCKKRALPLDFFSWHLYTDDPGECVIRARGLREVLDRFGFNRTELHLNEWNYLPANDWRPVTRAGQGEARRKFNEQLAGPAAAAFVASVLINLQNSPVDQANIFRADNGGFGLFAADGTPNKPFFAFKAINMLRQTPVMLQSTGGRLSKISICAGADRSRKKINILISNYRAAEDRIALEIFGTPWAGETNYQIYQLDARHDLVRVREVQGKSQIELELKDPVVYLISLVQGRVGKQP